MAIQKSNIKTHNVWANRTSWLSKARKINLLVYWIKARYQLNLWLGSIWQHKGMWGCDMCNCSKWTNAHYWAVKWSAQKIHTSTHHWIIKTFLETPPYDHWHQLWSYSTGFNRHHRSSEHIGNQFTRRKCVRVRKKRMLGFEMEWWPSDAIVIHVKGKIDDSYECHCWASNIYWRLYLRF